MAIATSNNLKKIDPNPQYVPKLKGPTIDTKLYTPKLTNPEFSYAEIEFPDPESENVNISLYTPDPEPETIKIPIYIPDPLAENIDSTIEIPDPVNDNTVSKLLVIPNPNEVEQSLDIMIPDPDEVIQHTSIIIPYPLAGKVDTTIIIPDISVEENVSISAPIINNPEIKEFDTTLYTPEKNDTEKLDNSAFSKFGKFFPLELKDFKEESYLLYPPSLPFAMELKYPTNEEIRGLTSEWMEKWKEIEEQYDHSEFRDKYNSQIEIKLTPTDSKGEEIIYDYSIPIMRLPKKWMYKGPFMSYANNAGVVYNSNIDPDTGEKIGTAADVWNANKKSPNPNMKIPEAPVTQGWGADAWKARGQEFVDEISDFFSAETWAGIGIDLAKDFATSLASSMLAFGGYDLSKKSSSKSEETEHLQIDRKDNKHITKWKEIPNYARSHLFNNIGRFVPMYREMGVYGGIVPVEGSISKSSVSYENGYIKPHIFSNFLISETDDFDGASWLNTPSVEIANRYRDGRFQMPKGNGMRKFNYDTLTKATHPINLINAIGPDFMKHKFDAFFVFHDYTGKIIPPDFSNERWMTAEQRFIYSHKGFAVRFGTISIPALSRESFDISYLEAVIKKQKTSVNGENKATFTFRLDNNLYWLDFMDKMAGHNNTVDALQFAVAEEVGNYKNIYYDSSKDNWKQYIKCIANSFSPNYTLSGENVYLSLVIKATQLSDYIHTGTQTEELPYFIFEDIRILGNSNTINYEREGSNTTNINVNFIFKFLTEIYIPNKLDSSKFKYVEGEKRKRTFDWSVHALESIPMLRTPQIYTYEGILGI
jgi:hypothetical protein